MKDIEILYIWTRQSIHAIGILEQTELYMVLALIFFQATRITTKRTDVVTYWSSDVSFLSPREILDCGQKKKDNSDSIVS